MKDILSPTKRRWAYRTAVAVTALLGVKGIIANEELLYWNLLFAALFSMASANVSEDEDEEVQEDVEYK